MEIVRIAAHNDLRFGRAGRGLLGGGPGQGGYLEPAGIVMGVVKEAVVKCCWTKFVKVLSGRCVKCSCNRGG